MLLFLKHDFLCFLKKITINRTVIKSVFRLYVSVYSSTSSALNGIFLKLYLRLNQILIIYIFVQALIASLEIVSIFWYDLKGKELHVRTSYLQFLIFLFIYFFVYLFLFIFFLLYSPFFFFSFVSFSVSPFEYFSFLLKMDINFFTSPSM